MNAIYLAGNISGLSYHEATDWRNTVTCDLRDKFLILDPMRGKKHLSNTTLGFSDNSVGCTTKEIFTRDTFDVFNCNIILAYITGYSIGTAFEIGMSYTLDKHIVIVTTPELALHPFLSESANYLTTELNDAVKYILDEVEYFSYSF